MDRLDRLGQRLTGHLSQGADSPVAGDCLSLVTLEQFLRRQLDHETRVRIDSHLDSCLVCLNQFVEMRDYFRGLAAPRKVSPRLRAKLRELIGDASPISFWLRLADTMRRVFYRPRPRWHDAAEVVLAQREVVTARYSLAMPRFPASRGRLADMMRRVFLFRISVGWLVASSATAAILTWIIVGLGSHLVGSPRPRPSSVFLSTAITGTTTSPCTTVLPQEGKQMARPTSSALSKLVNDSQNAVVRVTALDKDNLPQKCASGFFVDANGSLLTAYHVIEGARAISVNMSNGSLFAVEKVIFVDSQNDFAMLKVAGRNLPALKLGDSDKVQVGEEVVALGSPLGFENSVSTGIISGVRRMDDHVLIQTTASISSGSSGGPMLDAKGQVIGITVLSASGGQNLNFALAINDAKRVQANPSPKSDVERSIQAYLTGLLYLNNKDYVNAEQSLVRATQLDPKNVDAWLDLGTAYYKTGKRDKEGLAYKKAIELRPTSEDAHYLLGTWYEDRGEFDLAAEEFRRAISLDPKNEGALFDLALLELIRGRRTEAMQAYQQLKRLNYGLALKLFRILEVSDKARSRKP